jgi:23S rRNA pseudouridine2605 synthase
MAENLRLQKALAELGLSSRRAAAGLIKAGRVRVNGRVVFQPGERVDSAKDAITLNGKTYSRPKKLYLLLNKPKGIVTTVRDRHASRSVLDLIKPKFQRIYPVGRLDKDTTGLLLLTNDGELTYRLTHPKFGIKKVYHVRVKLEVGREELERLERGLLIEGKLTYPCKIKLISGTNKVSRLEVQLTEGRKRQIKKMFAAVGHPVISIERAAFGPLKLGGLLPGKWRPLNKGEIRQLKKVVGGRW